MAMKAHVLPDPENLRRLVSVVADRLAALPDRRAGLPAGSAWDRNIFEASQEALRLIFADLAATEGARTGNDWRGVTIRMAGIRATSTGGISGALHNWIMAAQRKIAQAEAGKAGAA